MPYMRLTTCDKKKLDSIIRQVYKLALGLPMATRTGAPKSCVSPRRPPGAPSCTGCGSSRNLCKKPRSTFRRRLGKCWKSARYHGICTLNITRRGERRELKRSISSIVRTPASFTWTPHRSRAENLACFANAVVNIGGSTVTQTSVTTKATAVAGGRGGRCTGLGPRGPPVNNDHQRNLDGSPQIRQWQAVRDTVWCGSPLTRLTREMKQHTHLQLEQHASDFHRGVNEAESNHPSMSKECLAVFQDILPHYRLERRVYPPPDKSFTKFQALRWRQLQTNAFPCPAFLRHIYPTCTKKSAAAGADPLPAAAATSGLCLHLFPSSDGGGAGCGICSRNIPSNMTRMRESSHLGCLSRTLLLPEERVLMTWAASRCGRLSLPVSETPCSAAEINPGPIRLARQKLGGFAGGSASVNVPFDGRCARCPPPDPTDGETSPTKATIAHLFWECPFDPPSPTLRDFVAHLQGGERTPWIHLGPCFSEARTHTFKPKWSPERI
ncbi:hypothetical protein HPB47_014438 [Ixodes persulcatus]|uniref:Uncharacterized protein n=1 Tax=Ixodes persulcatus TaxID=34615 RepID=A0AC60QXV3_IXOPE|nr:hypothetical protein HPB47_014438 [Ixodes persulcatus]